MNGIARNYYDRNHASRIRNESAVEHSAADSGEFIPDSVPSWRESYNFEIDGYPRGINPPRILVFIRAQPRNKRVPSPHVPMLYSINLATVRLLAFSSSHFPSPSLCFHAPPLKDLRHAGFAREIFIPLSRRVTGLLVAALSRTGKPCFGYLPVTLDRDNSIRLYPLLIPASLRRRFVIESSRTV